MTWLHLCISPVAGGKTRYSRHYARMNPGTVRLCPDELRAVIGESESDQTVNFPVFQTLHFTTEHLLRQGYSVIIDATNYTKKSRKGLLEIAKKCGAKTRAICFCVSIEEAKRRNAQRERVVPEEVIDKQYAGLQPPEDGEFDDVVQIAYDK